MAGLTGKTIAATFESLLKVGGASDADNVNITSSLVDVCDGLNNVSPLSIGSDKAKITVGTSGGSDFQVSNSSGASLLLIEGDNSTITMGDNLKLQSDSSRLYFGAGDDVFFEHSNDVGLFLNAGLKLGFRDMTEYIHSVSDGNLGLGAGTSIDLVCSAIDIGLGTSADTTINLLGTNNNMAIVYDESAKKLSFDSTDLVIDGTNSRVGIGIASPVCDLHIGGTNPQIRIGDDGAEDTSLCFMGNAQDFYIALDDTTDDLTIGTGTTIGSNIKMVVENGGNVGIGTTAPESLLHLAKAGTSTVTDGTELTNGAFLAIENTTTSNYAVNTLVGGIAFLQSDSGTSGSDVCGRIDSVSQANGADYDMQFWVSDSGTPKKALTLKTTSANPEALFTGKVGIGITDPDSLLEIGSTDASGSPGVTFINLSGSSGNSRLLICSTTTNAVSHIQTANNYDFQIRDTGGTTIAHFDDGNNFVGIGTVAPDCELHVASADVPNIRLEKNDDTVSDENEIGSIDFEHQEDGNAGLCARMICIAGSNDGDGEFLFQTGKGGTLTNKVRIDYTGNVGIGNDSPACKLQVAGAIAGAVTAFSTTGPTDNVDVSGTTILNCDTSSNHVTIGGFTGGVAGQILYIIKTSATNNLILEHAEGANQNIFVTSAGTDQTLAGRGGWTLVCDGSHWYACSSPTGEADAA